MYRKILPVIFLLALGTLACGFSVNLPSVATPGPMVTDQINVAPPAASGQVVNLALAFGAGTLKVENGGSSVVSGTAMYNIPDFKPKVTVNGSDVRLEQGNWKLTGISDLSNIKNEWDLKLGSFPMALSIEAGGYHAEYQFGGLALTNLTVKDGASDVKMDFAVPNQAEMSLFSYQTGASNVSLTNLANANFANLTFHSGAGNYTLDFNGTRKRDSSVNIETGISNFTLVIPEGYPVQLTVQGGLSNVTAGSGWSKNGNIYTQAGSGPRLTIVAQIGAGNLTLTK